MKKREYAIITLLALFLIGFWFLNNNETSLTGGVVHDIDDLFWDHMPLTYNIYNCSQNYIDRINKSTEYITGKVGNITFEFINIASPDISFICKNERKKEYENGILINRYAEAIPYYYPESNTYAPSAIFIYSVNTCPYGRPITEIHEILHLFGLEHPKYAYRDDIMNSRYVGCLSDITDKDLGYLNSIYGS